MWTCPHDELVLVNGGSLTSLELRRKEVGHGEETRVVKTVDPSLGARWELTVLGPNVVGLAEVVPCHDLHKAHFVAVGDDVLPAPDPKVLITVEDELDADTVSCEARKIMAGSNSRSC